MQATYSVSEPLGLESNTSAEHHSALVDNQKMKPKADIGIFIGYSESSRGFHLDNLFGPMYKEYYTSSSQEVSDNSAANTLDNENTSLSSSIVIEEDEAPQIVSSSEAQVATEPNSLVMNKQTYELIRR
uniref:Uncharacterized protein n=1 Tax=Tanacetum cinerariifolium TaxID=118510 RepID=A0A699HG48_TANCI|nr:hypothetical protein [Tanacetum cinerariifolium]